MAKASYRYQKVYKGIHIDLTASDPDELDEKVRQRKNEIDAGLNSKSANITVKAYGDKWVELKKPDISTPVYKAYKIYLNNYIYPHIGTMVIRNIDCSNIKAVIAACADKSVSLRSKVRLTLSSMFSAAVADRIITFNPATGIKIKKNTESKRRALTDEEAALLLKVCETHYAGPWIKMLYYTGMRPQESAPLTWNCIDKETHEVCIKKALKNTGKVGTTKTSSGVRRVVIPEPFYTELMTHEGEPDKYIFQTTEEKNTERGGHMLSYQTMKRRWKNIVREMNILLGQEIKRNQLQGDSKVSKDLTLYCLRHTYCTNLCRAGIPMKTAIELMGHINGNMIAEIYADYTADQAEAARKMLSNFFAPAGTSTGTKKAQGQ